MTCPQCGAAVKEGKFCNYCGAKLPDDTKRVEVRIDNTAEIKRAEYEEKESELRQKQEIRKYKAVSLKRKFTLALFGLLVVLSIVGFITQRSTNVIPLLFIIICTLLLLVWIVYQLITGRW